MSAWQAQNGLLGQQHAANIFMFDDPDAGALGAGGMFALHAQLGIIQSGVIGGADASQGEQARIQAFLVHIRKHLPHADTASVFTSASPTIQPQQLSFSPMERVAVVEP